MREQLRKELRRMQAMGRSLLLQREMAVSGPWWRGQLWVQIIEGMPSWVVRHLESWKKLIELAEKEALKKESELKEARAAQADLWRRRAHARTAESGTDRCAAL